MNNLELGRAIRAERKRTGLRQDELAALCGIGTRFLSELENGKDTVEFGRVARVLEALGLEFSLQRRDWDSLGDLRER